MFILVVVFCGRDVVKWVVDVDFSQGFLVPFEWVSVFGYHQDALVRSGEVVCASVFFVKFAGDVEVFDVKFDVGVACVAGEFLGESDDVEYSCFHIVYLLWLVSPVIHRG